LKCFPRFLCHALPVCHEGFLAPGTVTLSSSLCRAARWGEQMAGPMVSRNMWRITYAAWNRLSIVFVLKPINRFCRAFGGNRIVIKSIAILHGNVKKYLRRVNQESLRW
jgi:hypothetical protein